MARSPVNRWTHEHRIDGDVHRPPFLAERFGQAEQSGLGGGIVGLARRTTGSRYRGHVDHLAGDGQAGLPFGVGARLDVRIGRTKDSERRFQMHVLDGIPLFVADLVRQRQANSASGSGNQGHLS